MMKTTIFYSVLLLAILSTACSSDRTKKTNELESLNETQDSLARSASSDTISNDIDSTIVKKEVINDLEQRLIDAGLVDIQKVDSSLRVNVKYATTDNFVGMVLYKNYDKVYLQPEVAKRLAKANKALKEIDSTFTFLVYDGTRPRSVQQKMWDALDTLPVRQRTRFVSNPKNGSIHNFGSAVDLTIFDTKTNQPLDMGAGYDDIRKIAYPRHEEKFLKSGELTTKQVENRKLLRRVMRKGGFWVIQTEWWHFNAFSRPKAKELFDIVE